MKTLIVYASKTGTAAKCANLLSEQLPGSMVFDLTKEIPNPSDYDRVIVGGAIRAGGLTPKTKEYLENCRELLLQKELGLFLCCCDGGKAEEYLAANVPEDLAKHAKARGWFGAELNVAGAGFFEKLVMKMIRKNAEKTGTLPKILPENIARFAQDMNG